MAGLTRVRGAASIVRVESACAEGAFSASSGAAMSVLTVAGIDSMNKAIRSTSSYAVLGSGCRHRRKKACIMWLSNSGVAAGSHGCGAGGAALAVTRVINRRCLAGGRGQESLHFTRGLVSRA